MNQFVFGTKWSTIRACQTEKILGGFLVPFLGWEREHESETLFVLFVCFQVCKPQKIKKYAIYRNEERNNVTTLHLSCDNSNHILKVVANLWKDKHGAKPQLSDKFHKTRFFHSVNLYTGNFLMNKQDAKVLRRQGAAFTDSSSDHQGRKCFRQHTARHHVSVSASRGANPSHKNASFILLSVV